MKILSYKKMTDAKWLNFFSLDFEDENGRGHTWQMVSRSPQPKCIGGGMEAPDAVIIAAMHRSREKLVIVREYRVPLGGWEIGFPAGLVDEGETPEQAAQREMKEETGLTLTRIKAISPPLYSSSGMTDESVAMVYAECEGDPSDRNVQGTERIEVLFVSKEEAAEICRDSRTKFDVKTWLALTEYAGLSLMD